MKGRRYLSDRIFRGIFLFAALFAAAMIVLLLVFVTVRGIQPFLPSYPERQSILPFLTGMRWRADQGVYGVGFIIINTLVGSILGGLLALPLAVLSAIVIGRIAPPKISQALTTVVETLAAIPSVVYGVFAAGKITALVDDIASTFGISTYGGSSQLAVILLLAIMTYPTMTSLTISGIKAVPLTLDSASLALGATKMETYFKVVIPGARSSIFAGFSLGLGRAFGEATAVSMVAGNALIGPTTSLFERTRTLTSTILAGLHETVGLDYDIRFSVGVVLMIIILVTNAMIFGVKRHFDKKAEGK
ncbi:MAG: phosphate ABC transporter permease subunit PstC [Eubacteriales bacterium]|nr:phosphate ABC transporter permease subunit PstC [Eubacteriales bacterium]MDD4323650.1 phosphate ABC transporter permease subunit PstC [Eubacteriales bacterium]MDD4540848.1 phosphate ABC transporter permease subunit PstC [Eubacteriales bacterium]